MAVEPIPTTDCLIPSKPAVPSADRIELMTTWTFEPGHTAAEFRAKHMMVTWVRGHFKNVHGKLQFDPQDSAAGSVEVEIDASGIWTGEPARDDHLRAADFLDAQHYPKIVFKSRQVQNTGKNKFDVIGDLTIRGMTNPVILNVEYLGEWETPWWEDGVDKGPKTRAGFTATTKINRQDFKVSWNSSLDHGGVVVGDDVFITIDAEAIKD
jgi:polyisoprenoid-binding protein YceI